MEFNKFKEGLVNFKELTNNLKGTYILTGTAYDEIFLLITSMYPYKYIRIAIKETYGSLLGDYRILVDNKGIEKLIKLLELAENKNRFFEYYKEAKSNLENSYVNVQKEFLSRGYRIDIDYKKTGLLSYRLTGSINKHTVIIENNILSNKIQVSLSHDDRYITSFEEDEEFDVEVVEELINELELPKDNTMRFPYSEKSGEVSNKELL